jgi:hypothetical protein
LIHRTFEQQKTTEPVVWVLITQGNGENRKPGRSACGLHQSTKSGFGRIVFSKQNVPRFDLSAILLYQSGGFVGAFSTKDL